MDSSRAVPVAIVGGGFSGTMVAANLARRGIRSLLIEPRDVAGRGTAFSTDDPSHLLNVPAGNMSAWPDAPESFAEIAGDGASFAQRRQFGRYLRDILDEAIESGCVTLVRDRATGAKRDGSDWAIELRSGDTILAASLVLAIGNQPPAALPFAEAAGDRLIDNPWGDRARAAVKDSAARQLDVMILGTGLTMVDVVLSLYSAGHRGGILAVSRRGLIPKSHETYDPAPVEEHQLPPATSHDLIRWLRRRSETVGWRAAIDSLRPHSQRLWQALGPARQRPFLRHVRPWWDVHRHRIAPEVANRVEELMREGRLQVVAGRLLEARAADCALEVTIRKRGHDEPEPPQRFGYIFNCTGPLHDIGRTQDPLLRNLLDAGFIKADELGIGLAVDERSRVEGGEQLWALGSLTKGRYWEMIAVPDIRHQAAAVAEDIAMELGR